MWGLSLFWSKKYLQFSQFYFHQRFSGDATIYKNSGMELGQI